MKSGDRVLFQQYGCGCHRPEDCIDPITRAHDGQMATVMWLLDDEEVDEECQPMYRIAFDDGAEGDAFGFELSYPIGS